MNKGKKKICTTHADTLSMKEMSRRGLLLLAEEQAAWDTALVTLAPTHHMPIRDAEKLLYACDWAQPLPGQQDKKKQYVL